MAHAPKKDYYEVLGVARDADEEAIKKSYHELAKQYVPVRNLVDIAAARRFKEAKEAYAVLSNTRKRSHYDLLWQDSLEDRIEDLANRAGQPRSAISATAQGFMNGLWSMKEPHGTIACATILGITAASYLYGRSCGLDVAPFNWVLPSREIESFRRIVVESPQYVPSIGGYFGATIGLTGSMLFFSAGLLGRAVNEAVQSYRKF